MKYLFLIILFASSAYADKIPVHWNCYLPGDVVSCDELRLSFVSTNKDLELVAQSLAKVSISVRSIPLNSTIEYQFKFEGADKLPDIDFAIHPSNQLSSTEISERILKTLSNFLGAYRIALGQTVQDSNSDDKKYFFEPQAQLPFFKGQGYQGYNLNGSVEVNYSTPKWRVAGYGYLYKGDVKIDETAYSTGIRTKTFKIGTEGGVVRSFSKHWDIAIFAGSHSMDTDIELSRQEEGLTENALKNTATKTSFNAGVEWLAVPFIEDNSKGNIAFRYYVGPEFHKYVNPDTFENVDEVFVRHSLEIAVARHFNKIDVNFGVTAYKSSFRELPITGIKSSLSASYRITPRLSLNASYGLEYAKNRVASPIDAQTSFANLTSSDKTVFSYNGSVGVRYTLGNSRLKNKEQRWKRE